MRDVQLFWPNADPKVSAAMIRTKSSGKPVAHSTWSMHVQSIQCVVSIFEVQKATTADLVVTVEERQWAEIHRVIGISRFPQQEGRARPR